MSEQAGRRAFLQLVGVSASAGALGVGCKRDRAGSSETTAASARGRIPGPGLPREANEPLVPSARAPKADGELGAVEDLMREHGVIRRVLVFYREAAPRLRGNPAAVGPDVLQRAARLVRTFGEDYHERALEETHLFPMLAKAGGEPGRMIDSLLAQHRRGRDITQWILDKTQRPLGTGDVEPLARALEGFARMYEAHAAREDTVIFPAWKKLLSPQDLAAMGERFEDIEKKTFGGDGFDDALTEVVNLERAIGLDYAALLAPAPPLP